MSSPGDTLQTEYDFVLPKGYVDRDGTVHKRGVMRLATANDEIAPLRDPRVRQNQAYLTIILLSRVITRLGSLGEVNPSIIDLASGLGWVGSRILAACFRQTRDPEWTAA